LIVAVYLKKKNAEHFMKYKKIEKYPGKVKFLEIQIFPG
jgi:hypothetical protein